MAATITLTPMQTTGVPDSFLLLTDGFVAGTFLDDPAVRYQLEGGVVSSSQSTPLWGGLPLTLGIPALGGGGASSGLGPTVVAAASNAAINAWCLFNQAANGIIAPGSNVPQYGSGMTVNFARPGSNMRIVLPVVSSLVNTLIGQEPNYQVSWDFTNNRIMAYSGGVGALPVQIEFVNTNSKIVSYNSGTGQTTWTDNAAVAVCRI